jgi:hypothetical protein
MRQEFILLSDVLGLEMTVVHLNHSTDASETEAALLGPFYVPDAPELLKGGHGLCGNPPGEPLDVIGEIQGPKRQADCQCADSTSGSRAKTGFTRARIRTRQSSNCAANSVLIATDLSFQIGAT